jgi:hypothetical protein
MNMARSDDSAPTVSALIAQADALARASVLLKRDGDRFAAWWGGPGVVTAPDANHRHWLSID